MAASTTEPPVGIWQPGMHRPHRHLDRKGHQKSNKNQNLGLEGQGKLMPGEHIKTARLHVQIDKGHQCQQRSQKRVEEKLKGCIHTIRSAPDTDNQIHGNQGGLEKHIKKYAIKR
jgi:hypothetical protein